MRHLHTPAPLLLLAALTWVNASTVFIQGKIWQNFSVYDATLNDPGHAVHKEAPVSLLQCAELASLTFPSGIFCYNNVACDLHDVQDIVAIDKCLDNSSTSFCYTQHLPKPCCSFAVVPGLEDLGRLLGPPNIVLNFEDSRAYCRCQGGDLLVAPTVGAFLRLAAYYRNTSSLVNVWVGIEQNIWLDGRAVEPQAYYPGEPNDPPKSCSRMSNLKNKGFLLSDIKCKSTFNFLCQQN